MRGSVYLVVEVLRVAEQQVVLELLVESDAHEVVVPAAVLRDHEEAEESVGEQHLDALVVRRQVAFRVVSLVGVLSAPLVAGGGQLVGRQRTRTGCEAAFLLHFLLTLLAVRKTA